MKRAVSNSLSGAVESTTHKIREYLKGGKRYLKSDLMQKLFSTDEIGKEVVKEALSYLEKEGEVSIEKDVVSISSSS